MSDLHSILEIDRNVQSSETLRNDEYFPKGKIRVNTNLTDIADRQFICPHINNAKRRNLIVCIDGTSNKFGQKNTNVIELYHLILKEVGGNQKTWYNSGIGTYAQPHSWYQRLFKWLYEIEEQAFAFGFSETILGAYRWLCDKYEPGDAIFLFGFSRGAYQVRILEAMIAKVGLLFDGNENQIPFAYELFRNADSHKKSDDIVNVGVLPFLPQLGPKKSWFNRLFSQSKGDVPSIIPDSLKTTEADRFKMAFCHKDVKVHFVGAWDTVSSIGVSWLRKALPGVHGGLQDVCYFRHALALDERRVKFLPEYAYGGQGPPKEIVEEMTSSQSEKDDSVLTMPRFLEVWFSGTHSDIGGGNAFNAHLDQGRPPLRWMVQQAVAAGLRVTPFQRDLLVQDHFRLKESLTPFWWPFEFLPVKRFTFSRGSDKLGRETYWPHRGKGRKIHEGQKIHTSVMLASELNPTYRPAARHQDRIFWDMLREDTLDDLDWVEYDQLGVRTLVRSFIDKNRTGAFKILRKISRSGSGATLIFEVAREFIGSKRALPTNVHPPNLKASAKKNLLRLIVDLFTEENDGKSSFIFGTPNEISLFFSEIWNEKEEESRKQIRKLVKHLTDVCIYTSPCLPSPPLTVAFSSDGSQLIVGLKNGNLKLWDIATRAPIDPPLLGYTREVNCMVFSSDGKQIASCSDDKIIRLWDGMRQRWRKLSEKLPDDVRSMAFSPDGQSLLSCSDDRAIRVWDVVSGGIVGKPIQGHTGTVNCVAFSSNGNLIASGSDDKTIHLFNASSSLSGKHLFGHTDSIQTVAFSPDGTKIASGSTDCTIWLWDISDRQLVGIAFEGHAKTVQTVAFSHDGKRLVSGSLDKTVRVWDTQKGLQNTFEGHEDLVRSVAFSPDDKLIVSVSDDLTFKIWDAEILALSL